VGPTVPIVAPYVGKTQEPCGPLNMPARAIANRATVPCNLTGMPAISVPCGFAADGMPVGLQIMGAAFDEATVLRVAAAYEAATTGHEWRPSVGRGAGVKYPPMNLALEESNRRLLRARDAIDRTYAEELDVPKLAEIACVSEAHFIRSFRATFGETPHRY